MPSLNAPHPTNLLLKAAPTPHNGYLLYVDGDAVSAGIKTLPKPFEGELHKPERVVEVDAPRVGARVRITYKLQKYRHHKTVTWSWHAVWADLVDTPAP